MRGQLAGEGMFGTAEREDWKVKYREILTELENKERDWVALDKALRGVASRLAITAMGRDAKVDGHLDVILDAIKSRAPEAELLGELEELSVAVVQHEKHMATAQAVDLSSFVASLNLSPAAQRRCMEGLESDKVAQRMQALRELADELNALLQAATAAPQNADTGAAVPKILNALARHMDAVPGLASAVNELRKRMRGAVTEEARETLFRNLAEAVSSVIRSIDEDKSELEAFLEQVTRQLAQFEDWTRGNESEALARRQDTDSLEENVERQFDGLQSDMDASTGMSDLKRRVQTRLDSIADQLRVFRAQEERRLEESDKRNAALREEVNRLKVRTTQLAERCGDQENRLMHDTLTGVHTRYAYDQRLQEEFQRWQRHGQNLSYSIWDIDFFKKVNDSYGHQTGDRLLAIVAGMLSEQTRVEDFVARIGGEEFVVLFPATPLDMAAALSDRLREQIADAGFHYKGTPIPVTVSCGITEFRQGDTPQQVYERADKALYQAKNDGRNRCIQT